MQLVGTGDQLVEYIRQRALEHRQSVTMSEHRLRHMIQSVQARRISNRWEAPSISTCGWQAPSIGVCGWHVSHVHRLGHCPSTSNRCSHDQSEPASSKGSDLRGADQASIQQALSGGDRKQHLSKGLVPLPRPSRLTRAGPECLPTSPYSVRKTRSLCTLHLAALGGRTSV